MLLCVPDKKALASDALGFGSDLAMRTCSLYSLLLLVLGNSAFPRHVWPYECEVQYLPTTAQGAQKVGQMRK